MAQLGRSQPFRPHLPGPVVGVALPPGFVFGSIQVLERPSVRSFERRGAPHPHLTTPVVAPGGPVVPGITEQLVHATKDRNNLWRPPRAHVAAPLLFVPGTPFTAIPVLIRAPRIADRYRVPRPHVPGYVQPSGGNPYPSLQRSGQFPLAKSQLAAFRPHVGSALITFATPVIAAATILLQDPSKRWYRNPPKPHLVLPIVAPGGPVTAGETVILVTVGKRTLQLRRSPLPHVAPANLSPPAPKPPFPPTVLVSQSMRRPHIGRTTPRPHGAPPNLTHGPVPPGTFRSQCLRRPYIGRNTPKPHSTGPVVIPFIPGPNPNPPGVLVLQALRRPYIGRHVTQAVVVSPIIAAAPPVEAIMFDAVLVTNGWVVDGAQTGWGVTGSPSGWQVQTGQSGWQITKSTQHPWQEES